MNTGKMTDMDKTIRRVTDLKEQRAETYRYWQSRSVGDRLNAVWDATVESYAFKGIRPGAQRFERTLVRVQCSKG
jgi:hypothetical protein